MNPDRSGPMSTEGVAIALSKDEQRTLDEIERALREDDPRLVSAVNFGRFRRRRIIVGETAFIRGMIALVVGEVVSQVHIAGGVLVSVAGFIAMFVALARAILPGIRNRDYSFPLVADSSIPRPEMRPMFLSVQANGRCDPQPPAVTDTTKAFLSHWHADRVGDMPTLLWSLAKAGRRDPVEVWGPAGEFGPLGTRAFTQHLEAAHAWDMESLCGHPGQSAAMTVTTEVPYDRTAVVLRANSVSINRPDESCSRKCTSSRAKPLRWPAGRP